MRTRARPRRLPQRLLPWRNPRRVRLLRARRRHLTAALVPRRWRSRPLMTPAAERGQMTNPAVGPFGSLRPVPENSGVALPAHAIAVPVMVRSDCSLGVTFSLDLETGFPLGAVTSANWGLGALYRKGARRLLTVRLHWCRSPPKSSPRSVGCQTGRWRQVAARTCELNS
jgi:hypothetical protein